ATGRGRAHGETLRCGGPWSGVLRVKGENRPRPAGRASGAGEEVGGRSASGGVGAQRSVRLRLRVPVPGRSGTGTSTGTRRRTNAGPHVGRGSGLLPLHDLAQLAERVRRLAGEGA